MPTASNATTASARSNAPRASSAAIPAPMNATSPDNA